jgi:hypothetical protein
MRGSRSVAVIAALLTSLIGLPAARGHAQVPSLQEADAAREQKAAEVTPHERSATERLLFKLEDDLLLERLLDPPRGLYVRVGNVGEGSGFALGPAFRFNTFPFDFKTSVAVSAKRYVIGEAALRFPGTLGRDDYFKRSGPYIELYGRRRDFPQEDFFGLGPDSLFSDRSDFALRDTFGRVEGGYERGLLRAGTGIGYLDVSIGAGNDPRMPSSTEIFTIAEMPGVNDQLAFLVIEPFVEFATIDRALSDPAGGRYRVSVSQYKDRTLDRYSFWRWQADLRQYLSFVKDRRIIALRAWASSAQPDAAGQDVPFYLQPTLGGGRTLRAYNTFRFRDRSVLELQAEYRWRINEFIKGALFYDTGAVGRTLDALGRFERSYGFGLRAGGRKGAAFRMDFAFGGRDGHRVLVRMDDAF